MNVTCPNCNLISPEGAQKCDCGYSFTADRPRGSLTKQGQMPNRRPIGVWVVFVYEMLSAGFSLLFLALITSGSIKLPAAQGVPPPQLFDLFFALVIGVIGISAAVCLLLLRRIAVLLFSVALTLSICLTVFQMIRTNWIEAIGIGVLVGMLIGYLIPIAVIVYAHRLAKRGVLS